MRYFTNFWKYKELLTQFVARDLKLKYRRSVLGYLWSLLNPLLMMMVLTAVFSSFFKFDIPNYPVYLLSGQILFSFFSESTTTAMNSILGSGSLIKKVYIPKYIFPLSRILSSFVTLLFSLVALLIVMLITDIQFSATILLFPLPLFYLLIFSIGIGLIMSVLVVFFRDMLHLYGVLLSAWMYLTPIFYPINIVPDFVKTIIYSNPMYYFVEMFRELILYNQMPSLQLNLMCLMFSSISLLVGLFIFYKNQNKFVLHI
ncbi:MAG: ABC transporter permease [Candidatus Pristimantibacillus lignocellulolyticus]|uniref:Transport permease protein n=1 Tax=Candidatus Pristimantibacillus lignocellulolyticus TaxID=2994561 RepID=A0A9J6ZH16_9BACL|nr:MAG: ABC transporter permease [Candidatus Pristimantibacillus lignocellulolyticus]